MTVSMVTWPTITITLILEFPSSLETDFLSLTGLRQPVVVPCFRFVVSPDQSVHIGIFNVQSVGNKSTSITSWIAQENLSLAAVVETWHDGFDSPSLIACSPDGYPFLEQARPRSCMSYLTTNHDGVCLLYQKELRARQINMPKYRSVELICALETGCGLKLLVAVIHRPGPKAADNDFFNDLSDIFERLSHFSSAVVVGDLNLHLDISESVDTVKFSSLLEANNCRQYVESATHTAGHLLDVFIARTELPVHRIVVSPPDGLSDHSLIVAHVSSSESTNDYINRRCRTWGSFDVDNFMGDFDSSTLAMMLQNGSLLPHTAALFDLYFDTLSTLLDRHAPFHTKHLSTRRSEPWFDRDCRQFRRSTHRLERAYRRDSSVSSLIVLNEPIAVIVLCHHSPSWTSLSPW